MSQLAIWWIRRDLRLADNQALTHSLNNAKAIIPLFIIDDRLLASPYIGANRLAFLYEGLRVLDQQLQALGSRLVVRRGTPETVFAQLCAEYPIRAIYAEEDFSPYARQRDAALKAQYPILFVDGLAVRTPTRTLKPDRNPYTIFTPYSRTWKSRPLPDLTDLNQIPNQITTPPDITSTTIPTEPSLPIRNLFPPGELVARHRLDQFLNLNQSTGQAVYHYQTRRDRMDLDGTSKLSPYLRFGMLSARTVAAHAKDALERVTSDTQCESVVAWLNEIIWRDFYISILYHFPHVRQRSFRPEFVGIPWHNDPAQFEAWCHGQIGYPVVDAAMRQLKTIGWMHNRARMITASFLVKHLLIDWRWGERWFMQQLLDGDPASNNGAGSGQPEQAPTPRPTFACLTPFCRAKNLTPAEITSVSGCLSCVA